MVRKKAIIDGAINFVEENIVPEVNDKALSIGISFFVSRLRSKPDIAELFFRNSVVQQFLPEENGLYDIEGLLSSFESSIRQNGNAFPVTIPAIPLISPTEKELKFSAEDIGKLLACITNKNEAVSK